VQSLVDLKFVAEMKVNSSLVKLDFLPERGVIESLVKLMFLHQEEMFEPLENLELKHDRGERSPQVDSPMFLLQMGHCQILKLLMVVGCWSEIAQDEICQMKNGLVFKKEEILPQWESFWWFFSSWQAFLLSEVELIRFGSSVAYLDIS
jgi:hypothetical protein